MEIKKRRKGYLFLLFTIVSLLVLAACSDTPSSVLYKKGEFPEGQYYSLDALQQLPRGKIEQPAYFGIPLQFTDAGTPLDNDGREFTARVDHNAFIRLIKDVTDGASSKSVFKVIIPYPSPISDGSKYKFTTASPVTVLSKEQQLDNDGKPFSVYKCIYQGYLTIKRITYPQ
jgi:hypothetical protein